MSALYQTAGEVRAQVSRAYRLLWTGVLLFVAFIMACTFKTDYMTPRTVEGLVIAKSKVAETFGADAASQFLVSVRHPSGLEQNVKTTLSGYNQAEVGSKWLLTVTDAQLGHKMPLQHKLHVVFLVLTALGSLIAFVKVLRSLP